MALHTFKDQNGGYRFYFEKIFNLVLQMIRMYRHSPLHYQYLNMFPKIAKILIKFVFCLNQLSNAFRTLPTYCHYSPYITTCFSS